MNSPKLRSLEIVTMLPKKVCLWIENQAGTVVEVQINGQVLYLETHF